MMIVRMSLMVIVGMITYEDEIVGNCEDEFGGN